MTAIGRIAFAGPRLGEWSSMTTWEPAATVQHATPISRPNPTFARGSIGSVANQASTGAAFRP